MPIKTETSTDREKRGKLLLLAAFTALSLFISKIIQTDTLVVASRVYLNALIYFVIVFVGLLWSFNLQIKKKSLITLIQPALFVFSQELFVEFFFFQKFSRIYEAFILLGLVVVFFFINYFSFLSANIFNVSLFKKIPLLQVARTVSNIISVFMMYFITFSFLLSDFNVYILLGSLFLFYLLISLLNYVNNGIEEEGELFRKTFITTLIPFMLFSGVFLSGNVHEVISVIPVVGYFLTVGVATRESFVKIDSRSVAIQILVLVFAFFAVLVLNIFDM